MKKYIQAIGIWILIIPLAILNGALRETVLVNTLGNLALPLSGIILSVCILLVSYFLVPKIKDCNKKDYLIFGFIWFILTNLFDLALIIFEGKSIMDFLKMYDVFTGNLWLLVVITVLTAPSIAAKIRGAK